MAFQPASLARFLPGVPSLVLATGSQLGASLALLPLDGLGLALGEPAPLQAWGAVIALGVVCTGLAYVIFLPPDRAHRAIKSPVGHLRYSGIRHFVWRSAARGVGHSVDGLVRRSHHVGHLALHWLAVLGQGAFATG